jgi:hypothetical protein
VHPNFSAKSTLPLVAVTRYFSAQALLHSVEKFLKLPTGIFFFGEELLFGHPWR